MPEPTTITAIVPSSKKPGRALIKIGNRTAATLPVKVIEKMRLVVGMDWSAELAARVEDAAEFDKAASAVMKWVDRRALSRKRVGEKLAAAGWDEVMVGRVVEYLVRIGAVDDEALGRALIEEIQSRKPAGAALLRAKLEQHGVSGEVVEKLLNEIDDKPGNDPVIAAAELARGRLPSLKGLDSTTKKRRLWGLLARRGFESDTIEAALASVGELEDEDVP